MKTVLCLVPGSLWNYPCHYTDTWEAHSNFEKQRFLDHLQLRWQRNLQTMENDWSKKANVFQEVISAECIYRTLWWTLLIWDETPRFGKWSTLDLGEDCLLLMRFGSRKPLYTDMHNSIFVICCVKIIHCLHLFFSHFPSRRLLSRCL